MSCWLHGLRVYFLLWISTTPPPPLIDNISQNFLSESNFCLSLHLHRYLQAAKTQMSLGIYAASPKHLFKASDFFSKLVGQSDPWSKKWWAIFLNDGSKHIKLNAVDIWVVYFIYTLTLVCIYWLYSKTCLKWPLKKEEQLSLNAGQKYCRMLKEEHSAILSACIKLPFVIKIFVLSFFEWLLKTGFTVLTTHLYFLFCGVRRLAVRWIFSLILKVRFFHN